MLEVSADATLDVARNKFHDIARTSHPDLHRTTCTKDELELVTTAFALVAAAYQQFRSQTMSTTRMSPMARDKEKAETGPTDRLAEPPVGPQMTSKAIPHFRKAEQALKRGEIAAGMLHMKMAIAADPASKFLRTALTEIQAELAKKP